METGESSGNYSSVKVLCVPSCAKCSLITDIHLAPGDGLRMVSSETKGCSFMPYALC